MAQRSSLELGAEYLGLVQAIAESPRDDSFRLILADYLDERGDSQRAEFIRLEIKLAQYPDAWHLLYRTIPQIWPNILHEDWLAVNVSLDEVKQQRIDQAYEFCALRYRSDELFNAAPDGIKNWERWGSVCYLPLSSIKETFYRGFVDSLECTSDDWLSHADDLVWEPRHKRESFPSTIQPITKVKLTTRIGYRTTGRRDNFHGRHAWFVHPTYRQREWVLIHDETLVYTPLAMLQKEWPGIAFELREIPP